MRCADVVDRLVAYLDGECSPEERDRIESHLASCASCRRERALLDSTGDLLRHLGGTPKSGEGLLGRILRAARDDGAPLAGDAWCRHIRRELTAFLDGELSPAEARPVRDHLAECAACSAEAADLSRTGDALARWETRPFGTDLAARFAPARKGRGRRVLLLAAVAACLLVAAVALFRANSAPPAVPATEVLLALDVLEPETLDLLETDPALLEIAADLDFLEGLTDEEVALLDGTGG